jgi:hypothetical protein
LAVACVGEQFRLDQTSKFRHEVIRHRERVRWHEAAARFI